MKLCKVYRFDDSVFLFRVYDDFLLKIENDDKIFSIKMIEISCVFYICFRLLVVMVKFY